MSADLLVARWTRPARISAIRDDALLGAPATLVAAALAWRIGGAIAAIVAVLLGAMIVALVAGSRARRFDRRWLIAAIDATRADAEDSADLLFADTATLGPLARIQRTRIATRLERTPVPDLAVACRRWPIALAWIAALALVAAIVLTPTRDAKTMAPADEGLPAIPGIPRLVQQRLVVVPPRYTGLPTRTLPTLDARVPAGSRLVWSLRFAPQPDAATLSFPTGAGQPLTPDGALWTATRTLDRSLLYRVTPRGAERQGVPPLHRIDVVADQPPRVLLRAPATTLVAMTAGQRAWPIAFEATDDYGVAATARLRLVVAQGEGENVRFSERTIAVGGSGPATRRTFSARIDIAALGFDEPGDLVAQLTVADGAGHRVAGPSVILRRAARQVGESGLEAMTRRAMPAYFSSQRQIIIDAEALIAQRSRLSADAFVARSDSIGADQRLLRMRYGQFMGEEAGGGATAAMPTSDAEETPDVHAPDDAHDHAAPAVGPAPAPTFGADNNVLAEFGHTHDESEAATLLDPSTRATLRKALDAMWQSERALRQGDPKAALPPANTALRFIKQVQQATRIFLARTGTQLPPVDLARRLTGARTDLASGALAASVAPPLDATPAAIWRALAQRSDPAMLDALARWVDANAARVPDPLALTGAIDTLRRRPGCAACREALRGALWSALPRPAAGLTRRNAGDAIGRRYLESLP